MTSRIALVSTLGILLISCSEKKEPREDHIWKTLEVTATAFNSVPSQTDGNPTIAAWGDTLKPGMKSIAVSRDLIGLGLKHNTMVRIDTFPDIYLVKDKMHWRWRKRIDIYMGLDQKLARQWGKQKVMIQYAVKNDSIPPEDDTQ
ncbi:3D domain-containing protein [Spongiimicrobium sp. 2-473A-2-J]|uniref:3D domain-containing protein n=1 Tax=Eudoraea algarum TaxID=3417568 RepID=UPI003D36430A